MFLESKWQEPDEGIWESARQAAARQFSAGVYARRTGEHRQSSFGKRATLAAGISAEPRATAVFYVTVSNVRNRV